MIGTIQSNLRLDHYRDDLIEVIKGQDSLYTSCLVSCLIDTFFIEPNLAYFRFDYTSYNLEL